MNYKTFLTITALIFSVVALVHLLRIYAAWPILIGNWTVPMWLSWIGAVVAGGLAYFGFRLVARA